MRLQLLVRTGLVALLAAGSVAVAADPAAAWSVAPCVSGGPTAEDGALATRLNSTLTGSMRGYMTAYRVSCARAVVSAVEHRGMAERAAVIAITTTIVETTIQNVSETVDHDSLGLFQQRASWGSVSQRLDPAWATNAFLDKMVRLYPNNSWLSAPIGEICQAVQVSDFPDKYALRVGDARTIVTALWGSGVARDFNGDGHADLLARNATTKDVHLYRGDGSGFASGTGENIGNNFSAFDEFISVGDFSNDGNADLMVRNAATKNLHLYRGNGSGGFASGTGEQIGTNFSAFDRFVGIGDFSGDGKADLLVRNATTKNLHLYRGDGSGFASGTGEQVGTIDQEPAPVPRQRQRRVRLRHRRADRHQLQRLRHAHRRGRPAPVPR
ncbi:FG-GAP repeat domain-containing protein [Dactylosporangium aurantiacum]|uniref:FG-GAP repeat domain-containing protein n=1 Tax=Dactylosporangium aurantiacum TaxID=35754 RepID=UPI0009DE78FB|nr:VCBS repeat-containing protein [Dactylosporangium aurantiacum]